MNELCGARSPAVTNPCSTTEIHRASWTLLIIFMKVQELFHKRTQVNESNSPNPGEKKICGI